MYIGKTCVFNFKVDFYFRKILLAETMESKFSHLPDIKTIQPDRLIKYRVSEDKFSAEVLLPGLSYTDFDQKIGGNIYFCKPF
jgi:hypothetical protein